MSSNLEDDIHNYFHNPYLAPVENDSPDSGIPFYQDDEIDLQPYTSSSNSDPNYKVETSSYTESRESENETLVPMPQMHYPNIPNGWMPQGSSSKISNLS